MASPVASSVLCLLLVAFFAAGASAVSFTIKNNCNFTVWPAAPPFGGNVERLNPGQTGTVNVPIAFASQSGRIWGRTGCSFDKDGHGQCATGDCGGLSCSTSSGKPPVTLAEYTIAGGGATNDYYDISVIDGFNLPMDFSCSTGVKLRCRNPSCPDAYHNPNEPNKTHACSGDSNYDVTFCP
ncbi:Thaumatin-like protein [Dichanthelium oligosanthes]|uniref:Thaumatin-like protein n=1 Tax=Dichanthelium oligosanthes TaxID=888268 RepID=A0A1E5UYU1_9POAL|nr:Thaumatin-like protein [Dichanthelium oligosanthes]